MFGFPTPVSIIFFLPYKWYYYLRNCSLSLILHIVYYNNTIVNNSTNKIVGQTSSIDENLADRAKLFVWIWFLRLPKGSVHRIYFTIILRRYNIHIQQQKLSYMVIIFSLITQLYDCLTVFNTVVAIIIKKRHFEQFNLQEYLSWFF